MPATRRISPIIFFKMDRGKRAEPGLFEDLIVQISKKYDWGSVPTIQGIKRILSTKVITESSTSQPAMPANAETGVVSSWFSVVIAAVSTGSVVTNIS